VVTNQANPLALAALATAAVPGLDVVGVSLSHQTPDFVYCVAEDNTGRRWGIRLPRHQTAETASEGEIKLLSALRGAVAGASLPFEVISPLGFATDANGFRAVVYREPPGDPLALELLEAGPGLAASIGRAIGAWHSLAPALADEAGLPSLTPQAWRARLRQDVDRADQSGHVTFRLIQHWREWLDQDSNWVFTPVMIHGDMAAEHILVQGGRVTALLDLTEAKVSDPAEDLAPLVAAVPPEVGQSIIDAYRSSQPNLDDDNLDTRVEMLAEMAVIRWLLHGVDTDNQTIIDDARAMLADLDQSVAAEQAEATRLAAQAEEIHERLQAAKRASAAAAREHQRTSESIPRLEVPPGGTLDQTQSETAVADAESPALPEPGGQAGAGEESSGEANWGSVSASLAGLAPGDTTSQAGPKRKPITTDGVDMWGTAKQVTPTWEDDPLIAAAAIPPPGLDEASDQTGSAEAASQPVPTEAGDQPSSNQASDDGPVLTPSAGLDTAAFQPVLGLPPLGSPTKESLTEPTQADQADSAAAETPSEPGQATTGSLPEFLSETSEAAIKAEEPNK